MIQGAKKISELTTTTLNGSEVVPVVQDDGLGNLTTFKVPVSSVGTDTNFANTDLTFAASRSHNVAGYTLTIGATGVGQPMVLTAVNGNGLSTSSTNGNGVSASSTNGYAGEFYATNDIGIYSEGGNIGIQGVGTGSGQGGFFQSGSGIALTAVSSSGMGLRVTGAGYIESNGAGGTPATDAVLEANSTTQGALLPRMTTTQRNAISSPATGLEIYNTTTGRKEVYNGSFWRGISMRLMPIFHGQFNPTDAQTVAFGQSINAPTVSTNAYYEIIMRGAGVIRGCDLNMLVGGVTGTNESWSLYVRHNGTDYLVQTISSTTVVRNFSNTAMNIPYVDGDIVRMIYVNPTWATNPTAVTATGNLILL